MTSPLTLSALDQIIIFPYFPIAVFICCLHACLNKISAATAASVLPPSSNPAVSRSTFLLQTQTHISPLCPRPLQRKPIASILRISAAASAVKLVPISISTIATSAVCKSLFELSFKYPSVLIRHLGFNSSVLIRLPTFSLWASVQYFKWFSMYFWGDC